MKTLFYLISILLITIACVYQKPEKEEVKFINAAITRAKTANKLLILEFWTPECGPCIKLKYDIFENEKVRKFLNENFILVQISPSDSVYKPLWKLYNLASQSTVIFMDKNRNEIDRTVSYDGTRDSYLSYLKEVSEGRNLYSVVFSTYKKDTLNVKSNYVLAKKLLFRYQIEDAIKQFNKVLKYDPYNKLGYNAECTFRIAESKLILTGKTGKME